MSRFARFSISLAVFIGLVSLLPVPECQAAEPTLARLSFWVQPERMADFEKAYREQVLPILKRHGLMESPERGRATADNVFARLFKISSASEVFNKAKTLREDSAWQAVLRNLGTAFGTVTQGTLRHSFGVYTAPARPGRIVPASLGKVVPAGPGTGQWHAYGLTDGLPEGYVRAILQDREGYLWFGTAKGASRYDGQIFANFTTEGGSARWAASAATMGEHGPRLLQTRDWQEIVFSQCSRIGKGIFGLAALTAV